MVEVLVLGSSCNGDNVHRIHTLGVTLGVAATVKYQRHLPFDNTHAVKGQHLPCTVS